MHMGALNVISQNMTHDQLVVRYEVEDFNAKSQLIVDASQEAIFYKSGQALDLFGPGAHPLNSENVPLIRKIFGAIFNNKTPFPCHVYFINKITVVDMLWGTSAPIEVEDPKYHIIVGVGANGQTGVRIVDSRKFVEKIVGTISEYTTDAVRRAIKGKMQMMIKESIASAIVERGISVLEIGSHFSEIADSVLEKLNQRVASLGIMLDDFSIDGIRPREGDLAELTKIRNKSLERRTLTDDTEYEFARLNTSYQEKRKFDVLENAAKNEGAAGGFINMGVGMGVGVGMSRQMSDVTQTMQTNAMGGGVRPCSSCGMQIDANAKFCPHCGQQQAPQQKFCPQCGTPCAAGSKFCGNCGAKLM